VKPRAIAALAVLCGLSWGCLYQGRGRSFDASSAEARGVVVVPNVPELRQRDPRGCGVTALAALLAHHGIQVDPSEIRREIRTPEGVPASAGALVDYARRRGLDAFLVRGTFEDLQREVQAGRPALVGTVKPYLGDRWLAHYEVVVAWSPTVVVTMDPAQGFREYPHRGFLVEWDLAGSLLLVAAPAIAAAQPPPL
jgi:ABC-type bacteriocin/lantibiotic exporter with double-glycine peptidase domain